MSADGQTRPIRDAHRDLTQGRILDAAIDLLRNEDLDALKLSDVAAKAGLTERTLYRHFSGRDELLKAIWPRLQARVGSQGGFPTTAKQLVESPLWMFPNFDTEDGAVRAVTFSRAGRELRQAVNEQRKASIRRAVKDARPDLEDPELTRTCALIQMIGSSYGWAVMKDHWGLDGAEAGRAASDAIKLLLGMPAAPAAPAKAKKETKS